MVTFVNKAKILFFVPKSSLFLMTFSQYNEIDITKYIGQIFLLLCTHLIKSHSHKLVHKYIIMFEFRLFNNLSLNLNMRLA